MHEYIIFMSLIFFGAGLSITCIMLGVFVTFKMSAPNNSSSILKSPKGEVFTIPDSGASEFPLNEPEPGSNKDEQNILKRTEKFLKTIGGKDA